MSSLQELELLPRPQRLLPFSLLLLFLVGSLLPHFGSATCMGELAIDGVDKAYITGSGIMLEEDGKTMRLNHNTGISITSACSNGWDPNGFQHFSLLGRTLTFTVDVSQIGCACNVAVYVIQEPARDEGGNPTTGTCSYSPYYCDANMVCGQWCPEVDIMEANKMVLKATPHRCDPSNTAKFYNCDRKGFGRNTKDLPDSPYGPGAGHTIDTTKPFEVETYFAGANGTGNAVGEFTGMRTVLHQEGRQLVMETQASPDYLRDLARPMQDGMSIRITYWGHDAATMKWLDGGPCNAEVCDGSGQAILSNFRLSPFGSGPPERSSGGGSFDPRMFLLVVGVLTIMGGLGYLIYMQPLWWVNFREAFSVRFEHYRKEGTEEEDGDVSDDQNFRGGGCMICGGEAPVEDDFSLIANTPEGRVADRIAFILASAAALPSTLGQVWGIEAGAFDHAWEAATAWLYALFRPPFKLQDKVQYKGRPAVVVELLMTADRSDIVKLQANKIVQLSGESLLQAESEEQRRFKEKAPFYLKAVLVSAAALLLLLLVVLIVTFTKKA
mmetsp:Transcript_93582/g.195095  ORF Transcript_93582/g.195095 Transcript_93582/m.195095 type:complete len:554 (+) Transcript_93582:274-1935(+)|eukprot:CAMPEP_0206467268 /NCGR_PEP_ID=MMETSP0324_2-20121206/28941_1 /ASSEMBLY_ACC=CAM_ASM_000836 /TAXON_ID=2866 /ORGANISM="Crypthecodinium cohnii, Strain Seligo" /LENGTH=553 /DNA_ID=CAMNT_0053940519 /DNA_START=257 /DNA_END=1918 /DNA_ORIENTATION=+